jgi:hypothetical protein
MEIPGYRDFTDAQLVNEIDRLAQAGRENTVQLIASLEELDRRQLFLPAGYQSTYAYCTRRLLLSEGAAYAAIEAARASRRFPVILEKLADGSITLSTIGLIARHLTAANHLAVLAETQHKSKREVERVVARLKPLPDAPTIIRRMPAPATTVMRPADAARAAEAASSTITGGDMAASSQSALSLPEPEGARQMAVASPPRAVVAPLTPERFKLQITMDRDTHDTLREIQDLIRHAVPNGDAAVIVARALTLLRDQLLRRKAARVERPRVVLEGRRGDTDGADAGSNERPPAPRLIPAAVRREVWERDGGRCGFLGADGRCGERAFLEFHHRQPFAAGGVSSAGNIELRCRAHNGYEAHIFFGEAHVKRRRA